METANEDRTQDSNLRRIMLFHWAIAATRPLSFFPIFLRIVASIGRSAHLGVSGQRNGRIADAGRRRLSNKISTEGHSRNNICRWTRTAPSATRRLFRNYIHRSLINHMKSVKCELPSARRCKTWITNCSAHCFYSIHRFNSRWTLESRRRDTHCRGFRFIWWHPHRTYIRWRCRWKILRKTRSRVIWIRCCIDNIRWTLTRC